MSKLVASLFLLVTLVLASQYRDSAAQAQLERGVQEYKISRYADASAYFEQAVAIEPRCLRAKLYLATAYAQQYIPGAQLPENIARGERAIEHFKKVLEDDPKNAPSAAGIASSTST